MALENGNDLQNATNSKNPSYDEKRNLLKALTTLHSAVEGEKFPIDALEKVPVWINSAAQKLTSLYNGKELIDEREIKAYIQALQSYKGNGGKIVFTGGFDYDLVDTLSGEVADLKIEDGKVKVSFVLDNGETKSDEVELKDAFIPDFSFDCK